MDYNKHYTLLCERAKEREEPEGYFERHHVQPRCLGGSDDPENIVKLTPEEHYLAHQLLGKMHPDHKGLVWAALQMTGHSTDNRSTNKLYGWLRRKYQKVAKSRKGIQNGSFGRFWYHHPETLENIKCRPEEVPEGFIEGRKMKANNQCIVCGEETENSWSEYCHEHKNPYKRLAEERYQQFIESDHESVRSFAKSIGVHQPALTKSWKKFIPGYGQSKSGVPIKSSGKLYGSAVG